jgi:hypothetical protein
MLLDSRLSGNRFERRILKRVISEAMVEPLYPELTEVGLASVPLADMTEV